MRTNSLSVLACAFAASVAAAQAPQNQYVYFSTRAGRAPPEHDASVLIRR